MLHTTAAPSGINYALNPDLQGMSRLQVLDQIIAYAGQDGMRVILDHHRSTAGAGTSDNGLWYNSQYTEDQWVSDWQMLANRYKNNPTVIGFDLHNEPYNGTWGGGGAQRLGPRRGAGRKRCPAGESESADLRRRRGHLPGSELLVGRQSDGRQGPPDRAQRAQPGRLLPARLSELRVYTNPGSSQPISAPTCPTSSAMPGATSTRTNIAPIYLGEFGTKLQDPKDAVWLEALTSYLSGDLDNNGTDRHPGRHRGHELDVLVVEPQFR